MERGSGCCWTPVRNCSRSGGRGASWDVVGAVVGVAYRSLLGERRRPWRRVGEEGGVRMEGGVVEEKFGIDLGWSRWGEETEERECDAHHCLWCRTAASPPSSSSSSSSISSSSDNGGTCEGWASLASRGVWLHFAVCGGFRNDDGGKGDGGYGHSLHCGECRSVEGKAEVAVGPSSLAVRVSTDPSPNGAASFSSRSAGVSGGEAEGEGEKRGRRSDTAGLSPWARSFLAFSCGKGDGSEGKRKGGGGGGGGGELAVRFSSSSLRSEAGTHAVTESRAPPPPRHVNDAGEGGQVGVRAEDKGGGVDETLPGSL